MCSNINKANWIFDSRSQRLFQDILPAINYPLNTERHITGKRLGREDPRTVCLGQAHVTPWNDMVYAHGL